MVMSINAHNHLLKYKKKFRILITDMLKLKDGNFFVSDWLQNTNTIEF